MTMAGEEPDHPEIAFSYDSFSDWYDIYRETRLDIALKQVRTALGQILDQELGEQHRDRIRIDSGRVKSKQRTWNKVLTKYSDRVSCPPDVPEHVRDLVGLKIVGTNRADIGAVSQLFQEIANDDSESSTLICTYDESKDYVRSPKESGYRAIHFELIASVPLGLDFVPVVCELQLRTLLQDSWGDLTHEETYKPGTPVPSLVRTMSRRMADIMAAMDDMAQDLREVLDEESERNTVSDQDQKQQHLPNSKINRSSIEAPAAIEFLRDRARDLSRPYTFAALAWEVQREFGVGVTSSWFGYGSFKQLLTSSIPGQQIVHTNPGYVIPEGSRASDFELADQPPVPLPTGLARLKEIDNSFPVVPSNAWRVIFSALSEATKLDEFLKMPAEGRSLYAVSLLARDQTHTGQSSSISRRDLTYVTRGMQRSGSLAPGMSADEVAEVFISLVKDRLVRLGLSKKEIEESNSWLRGEN